MPLIDTKLAKGYCLVKLKNENNPVRPIISVVNNPTYELARVLYNDLKKSFPEPRSHINNSTEFVSEIKGSKLNNDEMFISVNVSSMFTNVTGELVIKGLEKRAHLIQRKCKIPFDEIIRCTRFYLTIEFLFSIIHYTNKLEVALWVRLYHPYLPTL